MAPLFMSTLENETTDAWRQFLAKGNIEDAYKYCQTQEQKLYLAGLWADQYFEKGKHQKAAQLYVESNRSFEEICLKFSKLGSKLGDHSLEKYLSFCLEKYNRRAARHALSAEENGSNLYNQERT